MPSRNGTKASSAAGERTRTAMGAVLRHAALVAEPADSLAGIRSHDEPDERNRNTQIRTLCRALGVSRDTEDRAIDEQWDDADIRQAVQHRSRAGYPHHEPSDVRRSGLHTVLP